MSNPELVLVEQIGATRVLTLNRPEVRNAMSQNLNTRLTDLLKAADADRAVNVILLAGSGGAFCAGMDLKELAAAGFDGSRHGENCIDQLAATATPVIGLVDGPAVSGGLELALACDFLIASTTARFADTHSRVGVVPGGGLTARLSEAVGVRRARQLSGTGHYVDSATALAWGLVNEVVEPSLLRKRGLAVAEAFDAADTATLRQVWNLYDAVITDRTSAAVTREAEVNHAWVTAPELLAQSTFAVVKHGRAQ